MNLFNNPERNLFTFEKEQNNLTYVKFGKCNKVSALADVNNSEGGKLGEINSVIGDFDNSNIKFVDKLFTTRPCLYSFVKANVMAQENAIRKAF